MPYQAPGVRVIAINTVAGLKHGNVVNIKGVKGTAHKTKQADRWTLPANAQDIAVSEEFVIAVGGVIEVPIAAPVAALIVGDYLECAINSATLTEGTVGTVTAATVGVVQSVDTTRTPNVARVNTNLP